MLATQEQLAARTGSIWKSGEFMMDTGLRRYDDIKKKYGHKKHK
jgi:hypothetical protein